jgi:hypothetical protein
MMTKKVLVVVNGGVASAYAEYGVEVVCVDLDDSKVMVENDMIPIHSSFVPLMEFAEINGEWPVSDDGRRDDADHLEASGLYGCADQAGNVNRPIRMVLDVEGGLIHAIRSDSSTEIQVVINDSDVEGADADEMATLEDGTEFVGRIESVMRDDQFVKRYFLAFGVETFAADQQQGSYVAGKGEVCPACGSDNIYLASPMETDGGDAWGNCYCLGCKASWQDCYQLTGFINLT